MIDLYLHMGIALALVSGLILLLGLFLKKRQEKEGLMKVMGYQSLGPKKGIAMVKIGQEVLLVGVTATDIKLLKAMDARVHEPETERQPEIERPPEKACRIIMADTSDKLRTLKALKNTLKDAMYAVK